MKKQILSPVLNIAAMLLIILSRVVSDNGFDLFAIAALIILILSTANLIVNYKKLKNLK